MPRPGPLEKGFPMTLERREQRERQRTEWRSIRDRELVDWLAVKTAIYFEHHPFRVEGKTLLCPGLVVCSQRVDRIDFSTSELAQRAMKCMAANVVARLLDEKQQDLCGHIATGQKSAHTELRARQRAKQWLRGFRPNAAAPPEVWREMLHAAGVRDPRYVKITRILRNADGVIVGMETDR